MLSSWVLIFLPSFKRLWGEAPRLHLWFALALEPGRVGPQPNVTFRSSRPTKSRSEQRS